MQRVMLENLDEQGTADIDVTQEPLDFTVAKEDGHVLQWNAAYDEK